MTVETRTEERVVSVQEHRRRSLATIPDARGPAPLVLVLHGSNQTPETIRAFTRPGFDMLARRHGAIVAYPEGYRKHWNDARASSRFAARRRGYDDVGFLAAVIDDAVAAFGADPARVYAVGFSNGGQLASRLAHERPELLAGIAMIGATQPVPENFAPDRDVAAALPVMLVHGTKDPIVPYDGGMARMLGLLPRGRGLSAVQTAEYWARRNGIRSAPVDSVLTSVPGDDTEVMRSDYARPGAPGVRLFTIRGGGHTIPGEKNAPRIMGRTSHSIRTVQEIAEYFGLAGRG